MGVGIWEWGFGDGDLGIPFQNTSQNISQKSLPPKKVPDYGNINVLSLMCGEMLGIGLDGIPYSLDDDEKLRFHSALKKADLIIDHQHNRFPYPAQVGPR